MSSDSSDTSNNASPASTAPSSVLDNKLDCPIQSEYAKFRPKYHLQPRTGWLNDPCAPGYDHRTGLYHLSFQHNPNGPDWGDICWSSMSSPDLIHWAINERPILMVDECYDAKGVFTGCLIPTTSLENDEAMTVAYTSVSALPIHHTLPHLRGCESLSVAQSFDHGKTWVKSESNPILPGEPEDLDVTGWRDPFVAQWPSMSRVLGMDSTNTLFGIISGGIRNDTPTTFLYSIDRRDLTRWTYLGPLTRPGMNYRPSQWSGDFGKNWEVTNFMTLYDEHDACISREFLVMGTEGGVTSSNCNGATSIGPSRPVRGQLWMAGSLQKKTSGPEREQVSGVEMSCNYTGFLDHGCFYAANSFRDPVSCRQVVWGWVTEEDLCDELRHAQGWSGLLSLPRELFLQTLDHVVGTIAGTPLCEMTSIETKPDQHGSFTVRTLASRPVPRVVQQLRQSADVHFTKLEATNLLSGRTVSMAAGRIETKAWELDCSFQVSSQCQRIGVRFVHSECRSQCTVLTFHPAQEEFTIDRPSLKTTNSVRWINSSKERAPHTLFTFQDPKTGARSTEPLRIQMWRDNSVIEVFVNGRTAITSRLFAAEETLSVEIFSDDGEVDECKHAGHDSASRLLSATFSDGIGIDQFVEFV